MCVLRVCVYVYVCHVMWWKRSILVILRGTERETERYVYMCACVCVYVLYERMPRGREEEVLGLKEVRIV